MKNPKLENRTEIDYSGFPKSTQEKVGYEEPKPFKDMLPLTKVQWEKFKKNPIPSKKEEPKQETLEEAIKQAIDTQLKPETLKELKDLTYYKANAEEDYLAVPISVLRYISQLEQEIERKYSKQEVKQMLIDCCAEVSCEDGTLVGKTPEELCKWLDKQFKNK